MNIMRKLIETERELTKLALKLLLETPDHATRTQMVDKLNYLSRTIGEVTDEYDRRAFPPRSGE